MATVTASLAASSVQPPSVHTGGVLMGTYSGALSVSGSSMLLMAKVSAQAKVQVHILSGAQTQVLNVGIKPGTAGSNTLSVSAFGAVTNAAAFLSAPLSMEDRWNAAAGETYKYIVASVQSGSETASINYQITYSFE